MCIDNLAWYSWFPVLFVALLVTACVAPAPTSTSVIKISADEWQAVTNMRILFGHQSVGNNILDGVRQLAEQAQVTLSITENRISSGPGITHFRIGRNRDPASKILDFSSALHEADSGRQPDVAMMKLCYIDINRNSDIKALANQYIGAMAQLSRQFPHTRFVAVTVPLTAVQTGPKGWVKRFMGKVPSGYLENDRREEFNQIVRGRFGAEGLLFDLAEVESRGSLATFNDQRFKVLDPLLTDDGGHLNTLGQQFVAAAWIKTLVKVGRL